MTTNKNLYSNVIIRGIGTYLPDNKVGNEPYIEHFKKLGVDHIEHIFEALGRKDRFIAAKDETVITMAAKASVVALEKAKLSVEDLDMVVFATNTPEYFTPSNALLLYHELGAKNTKMVYDLNCDCAGLTVALDNVSRMLKTNNRYKKALVVGGVMMNTYARKDDVMGYGTFSDCASAVILEVVEEEKERGFIDSTYFTDPFEINFGRNPRIGLSTYFRSDVTDKEEIKFWSAPVGESPFPKVWKNLIEEICETNNLNTEEIDYLLLPPLSKKMCEDSLKMVYPDTYESKFKFLSEELGYLGVNSEIFELQDALNRGVVSEGSNVLMSGSGLGFTTMMVLYRL